MEIYIEYAFIENFLFDGILLYLALKGSKTPVKRWRLILSSALGAIFAILFPLLKLPVGLGTVFKLSAGALLCMLAFGRLKSKNEWGRYAFTLTFFYCFSFGFGGALLGIYGGERVERIAAYCGFAVLTGVALILIKKLYARRVIHSKTYFCRIFSEKSSVETLAFHDSGNLATKNGRPVCFLSPLLFYELWGEEIVESGGQVCDEMQISTLAGVQTVPLYKGVIEVKTENGERRKDAYFVSSKNMIGREYQVLLGAGILETENGYEMD